MHGFVPLRSFPAHIAVPLLTALACSPLSAQRAVHQWFGNDFGIVPFVGDIDGDGVHELLLTGWTLDVGPLRRAGRLAVLSGRTKQVIHDRLGNVAEMQFGMLPPHFLRGPFVDGDGDKKPDVPVIHMEDQVAVFSVLNGQNFETIDSFTSTESYHLVGDIDGDGISDRLVGRPNAIRFSASYGQVVAFSGATGRVIYEIWGTAINQGFGAAIQPTPDLDGDRVADFVVHSISGFAESRRHSLTQIVSGRTGVEILPRPLGLPVYGDWVSIHHDLNGDGSLDVLSYSRVGGFRGPFSGRVRAFAGPSYQTVLFDIVRGTPWLNPFGSFTESCNDIDGDGCDDFVVNEQVEASGPYSFSVLSGRDQSELFRVAHDSRNESALSFRPAHGDYDGDEFPDFIASAREIAKSRNRIDLRSGAPDGVDVLGRACLDASGHTPRIGASYKPEPGRPFHVNLSRVVPGQSAWLILGASSTTYAGLPLPLDLGPIGLPGCDLSVSADMTLPVTTTGVNGIGRAVVPLAIPNDSGLRGAVFHAQWLVLGRGGVGSAGTTTRALKVTIQ